MEEASSSALRTSSYMFLLIQCTSLAWIIDKFLVQCEGSCDVWYVEAYYPCMFGSTTDLNMLRGTISIEPVESCYTLAPNLVISSTVIKKMNGLAQDCSLSLIGFLVKCLWVAFAILLFVNWSDRMSAGVLNPAKRQHGVLQCIAEETELEFQHVMVWFWRKLLLSVLWLTSDIQQSCARQVRLKLSRPFARFCIDCRRSGEFCHDMQVTIRALPRCSISPYVRCLHRCTMLHPGCPDEAKRLGGPLWPHSCGTLLMFTVFFLAVCDSHQGFRWF